MLFRSTVHRATKIQTRLKRLGTRFTSGANVALDAWRGRSLGGEEGQDAKGWSGVRSCWCHLLPDDRGAIPRASHVSTQSSSPRFQSENGNTSHKVAESIQRAILCLLF